MARNILVIDDSAAIRALMRLVLEQAGHQVLEAHDGEDAYEMLDGRPLDLILCDLAMPRMDGMSFCGCCATTRATAARHWPW